MTNASPLQVEVNIQDCYFAEFRVDDAEAIDPHETSCPISVETWETWFQCWLEQRQSDLPPGHSYELSLRLTNDAEIQALNAQYRHKNQPTDVLAFAALEVDYPQPDEDQEFLPLYLGDIVISIDTARKQADQLGHSLQQELAWLAAHALLHLLGWDHPDEASLACMLKQQEFLLQTVGVPIDYYQIENPTPQEYLGAESCKV